MTFTELRTIQAAVRKYGPVLCKTCGSRTAKVTESENPFDSDDVRFVYECHGKRDYRMIDVTRERDPSRLFAWILEPVFLPRVASYGTGRQMSKEARRERRLAFS